jgi:hypothetical protein
MNNIVKKKFYIMRKFVFIVFILSLLFTFVTEADVYTEDFTVDPEWAGGFEVIDGQYVRTSTQWGRSRAFAPNTWFINGSISVTATVTDTANDPTYGGSYGIGSFGVLIKYDGPMHDLYVRFGAYDNITMANLSLGAFIPVVGRSYQIDVTVNGDQIGISLDGAPLSGSPFTVPNMAGQEGRVGLYCESPASFDNFTVNGIQPRPHAMPRVITGTSDLSLEFATYRGDIPADNEAFSVHGTLYAYVRNNGTGPAVIDNVLYAGEDADTLVAKGLLDYTFMRPQFINPGEVGEVSLRIKGFSRAQTLALMKEPTLELMESLTIIPSTGQPLKTAVPVGIKPHPIQINYMAFSEDLKTIYVYLQNNRRIYEGTGGQYTIKKVQVNGQDVTSSTTFGSSAIYDQVIPLKIDLATPLHDGWYTVVTVETFEGESCGHTLRAVPSEIVICVPVFVPEKPPTLNLLTHEEATADIYNHCATSTMWVEHDAAKNAGLDMQEMAGWRTPMTPGVYLNQMDSLYPDFIGVWLDEVDKSVPPQVLPSWQNVDYFFVRDGSGYPPLMLNVM